MNNELKPRFKVSMIFMPIPIYCFVFSLWFLLDLQNLYLMVLILCGYFWFAYSIRFINVYENGIEIYFPLRFRPIYRNRRIFFPYVEIERIIVDEVARVTTRFIVLNRKHQFLRKKNDYYFFSPDIKRKKELTLFVFLKGKGIKIDIRPKDMTPDELKD